MKIGRLSIPAILILLIPSAPIYFFSAWPTYNFSAGEETALLVSFKHTTARKSACNEEQLREYKAYAKGRRKHMRRKDSLCGGRERVPMRVIITIDGEKRLDKEFIASGWRNDGATYLYERFIPSLGEHTVTINMNDSGGKKSDNSFSDTLNFKPNKVIVIDFDQDTKRYIVR